MLLTLIIILVVALIMIAVIVNAVQQHRDRMASLKRAEFSKLRTTLEDTENLLMNAANVPMTPAISQVLLRRIAFTLKAMVELEPSSRDIKNRLNETQSRLKSYDDKSLEAPMSEGISLPDDDKLLIGLIQGIKKLRLILRSEHARGNVDTQVVVQEDRRLEGLQLRINVESQIKRGMKARGSEMLGSARQYFEKALSALENAPNPDDYVLSRKSEVMQSLQEIAGELKNSNQRDRDKKAEQENKDLDELFAPKRKW
ncbi:hypothetical protein Q3O60_16660 [Alkalimonas collagenimarina]|uniref:DNA repair protein n=1 Tax=Alkalimonas collagenimarina TaxID=400390 RepID=A0ABT9H3F1_9GAMM|nr:hypothetical protein [Alkalimonas collagenimarina]MDP4537817.1 hypothetical protein [Alkalimonas collagenimarina]